MRRAKWTVLLGVFAAVTMLFGVSGAQAEYPDKPITFVVNYGAGGTVGPTYLASKKPNGYTIGVTSFSPMGVAPHLMKVTYDLKDFSFIAGVCRYLYGVAVKADSPYKTWDDLMKAIQSGKRINFATPSPVQAILFPRLANLEGKKFDNVVWVRYKSGKQTTVALLGGHVDLIVGNPMDIAPQVKSGEMRMLASASPVRWPLLPDIPTIKELGYDVSIDSWLGFAAPAGIEDSRRIKLQAAFKAAVSDKTVAAKMIDLGMAPKFMTGPAYGKFCAEGKVEMGKDLKAIGLVKK